MLSVRTTRRLLRAYSDEREPWEDDDDAAQSCLDLEVDQYFPLEIQRNDVHSPLRTTEMAGRIDVFVNVRGSGKHSQSGAVALGLARALKELRPDLEGSLRDNGFLTRDARMVERKKYGHKKARKSFQFSKR